MNLLASAVRICADFLGKFFELLFEILVGKEPQGLYRATFISEKKLLSKRNHGFCLTGIRNLSEHDSFRNAMIIGGTGVGKSSIVLLPSLFTMQGSFVVHDPAGELYYKSAGDLLRRGYQIKVLNFADPDRSDGYNPLLRANSSSEINKVATLLIRTTLGSVHKDPFWNLQAITLLSLMIHLVKTQRPEYQNLAGVRYFLSVFRVNPAEIEHFFAHVRNPEIEREYQAFLSLDQKVQAGVVATCLSALQLFTDDKVVSVTSHDSIILSDFRTRKTALFIQNPVSDQKYYATLSSLFLEQLFTSLLQFPAAGDQSVFALIDEAASLYLPSLSMLSANVRKYRCGLLLSLQDFSQLIDVYGKADAETIRANCFAKLYFTGQSLATSQELEQLLGLTQRKDQHGREMIRPLISRDEIRTLKTSQALLVCGNYHPIVAKLTPYYQTQRLLARSKLAPPALRSYPPVRPTLPALTSSHHEIGQKIK